MPELCQQCDHELPEGAEDCPRCSKSDPPLEKVVIEAVQLTITAEEPDPGEAPPEGPLSEALRPSSVADPPRVIIDDTPPMLPPLQEGSPFDFRLRLLQALSGVVLLTVFLLPWNGARSWELLRFLTGLDFARQMLLLLGGVVLLSTGVLPVPPLFRAVVGSATCVAALCLGGGGLVLPTVEQSVLALLALTLLPAMLVLRSELRQDRLPRLLGLLTLIALCALYLLPPGARAPLQVAIDLIGKSEDMARFAGTYLLLPLPLMGLAAVALYGQDVAVIGELLGWLLLCWGPGALLVLATDHTQAFSAAALLCYSASACYGLAQVLSGRRAPAVV